jgi:hypothetical protein
LLGTNPRKDLPLEVGGWSCGRRCRIEDAVHLLKLFKFTLAISTGSQVTLNLGCLFRLESTEGEGC